MSLRVLVLGSGGREHALAWKLSQSPRVERIFVAPGNGGTALGAKSVNVDIQVDAFAQLTSFAVEQNVDLVIPGPEQPLVDGVESQFRKVGIPVFGPTARAAAMEGSKAFAKDFMTRHAVPTAAFKTFSSSQHVEAVEYVKTCGHRVVLKASGLAAGKGVLVPETLDETLHGLEQIMCHHVFGDAGREVVVEEYLDGPELSVLAFCDGYTIVPLPPAQDHKRIGDGDVGLNTGGMGAYAPAPAGSPAVMERILEDSLKPTVRGMRQEGFPFVGLLFTGFILTATGPKVLEYNVRFGDPETEAILLLLDDLCDLAEILLACTQHCLDSVKITFKAGAAVSVVLASRGYPASYPKGIEITSVQVPQDVVVFHAGTSTRDGKLVTSGGRVMVISAHAPTLAEALQRAYAGVAAISFEGKTYRTDIARRAIHPPSAESLTYASAGVSVDAGNAFVEAIKPFIRTTKRPGADGTIGGFGGVFDLRAAGFTDPVLVSGTDGVGTKLMVAAAIGIHDSIGIDLVAMSVNDLVVQGAEPLYFLDYYGCSKLRVKLAAAVVKGIAEGCRLAGCALIGGETAEMPGMYKGDDYDLAGFAVGAVERHQILPRPNIQAGDILLGLESSGVHSNGFSLIRKILHRRQLDYSSPCPWLPGKSLGEALLEPTRIYVKQILPAVRRGLLKGMAHITGGGFIENIPRVLPDGLGCVVDVSMWELPPVFAFLMQQGNVTPLEMARTFNNGIGMVLVVAAEMADQAAHALAAAGSAQVIRLGEVVPGDGVKLHRIELWNCGKT